jgi:hypothetical protein
MEDFLMVKPFDPLSFIPTANAVRKRIAQIQDEARRLDVLLKTAEGIENEKNDETAEGRPEMSSCGKVIR